MTTTTPNIVSASDEELLEACAGGNREAFRPILERYQSLLCSIAYAIVGDFKKSEEVAQEASIAAWRGLGTLSERGKFKAWITGITRNLAHHAIRGQRRMVSLETAAGEAAPEPGPVQEAISREEEAIVWGA